MLVSWLIFPVVLLAVAAGCGLAVARAGGSGLPRPLVLPVGFAAMVVVASAATASGATAALATPLVVVLAVAGFALAPDRRAFLPDRWAGAAAAGVYAAFAAPVVLSGSATFTGYIQLDDIATWLALTDQVMERGRDVGVLQPSTFEATISSYLPPGYPVGAFLPLGLGGKLTLGRDIAWLFAPTLALTAALLALTITNLVAPLLTRGWARCVVALVAAQPALLFAYAEWGAMKELVAAQLVALVAALAPTLGGPARGVLPLAVAIAALVAALSLGGGVWVVPVVLVALLASAARPRALLRSVGALALAVAALSVPSLLLAETFLVPQIATGSVLTVATELGNLRGPLGLDRVLGIWPAGDFRVEPDARTLTFALLVGLLAAAVAGVGVAVERRAGGLLGYVAGGLAGAAVLVSRGSPWVDGKAMATASPMVLTLGLAFLAWVATESRWCRGLARPAALAGLAALALGVAWSNVLGYSSAYVAPRAQLSELEAAGAELAGEGPTLMTEYEPYGARHFLRDADAESASELRRRVIPLRDGSQLPKSASADVGAFDPTALREYRSLVLRTSPLASRPPSAYVRTRAGASYDLWQRPATAPRPIVADLPLGGDAQPGAVPDCAAVRGLAAQAGPGGRLVTVARGAPLVIALGEARLSGAVTRDAADPRVVVPTDDGGVEATVGVPAGGDYAVWLGGSTRGTTSVRIDGREAGSISGRLNNRGGMMRFGVLRLAAGTHRVTLRYGDGGLAPGRRGQASLPLTLGPLVMAPREPALEPFSVAADRATTLCGRRLDWIEAHAR